MFGAGRARGRSVLIRQELPARRGGTQKLPGRGEADTAQTQRFLQFAGPARLLRENIQSVLIRVALRRVCMFFLLGSVGAGALNFLAGKGSQPSSRSSIAGGSASTINGSSNQSANPANASQSPTMASGPSPGWTPLSPSVLGFLIQNQGASSAGGTAASQAGRLSAASDANPNGFRSQFSQLVGALNAGNLTEARTAYSTLSQSANAQSASGTPFAQALGQIGQDLATGNVSGAQQTLSTLQSQTPDAANGMHHHHGARGAPHASGSGENPAVSSTGDSPTADIGTTSVTTNADGSTTTTTTYADGSTVTTNTPASTNAAGGSTGVGSNSAKVPPTAMTNKVMEALIQMQAQHLSQAASVNS
jgi:hypothetical protein